jgi:hypothetical protein
MKGPTLNPLWHRAGTYGFPFYIKLLKQDYNSDDEMVEVKLHSLVTAEAKG